MMNDKLKNDHFLAALEAAELTHESDIEHRLICGGQDFVMVTLNDMEFAVYTEQARDDAWEMNLDWYIDDGVLPEMPEHLHYYFDEEKWKRDARFDGAGVWLAPYDGIEEVVAIDGIDFYVYRQN